MTTYKSIKYNISGADLTGLTASQIPNLDTAKITTGTMADARIAASNVTQHVTATDLQPLKSDLTALAIREATNEASAAFNLPHSFIETFTDDTNLGTQTDGDRFSGYWATAGIGSPAYDSGDRSSTYTITHNASLWASTSADGLVDGSTADDFLMGNGVTQPSGVYVRFDRGSGNTAVYQGVQMIRQNTSKQGGSAWAWQGSQDAISWTTLLGSQEFGGATTTTYAFTGNSTAYRYIQWTHVGSTVVTNFACHNKEWYFYIAPLTASATGTLIQTANAVTGTRTTVGGTFMYKDNAGTNSIGTDLKIYFTANGGTNWTEASGYTAITPVYSTGIKQVRLTETTVTGGTDVRYKAVWANQAVGSKEAQLHGIGINY